MPTKASSEYRDFTLLMSDKKVNLALVGSGVIGKRHLLAARSCPQIELVAIADPSSQAKELADDLAVPHFSDNEVMLQQCQPDGVIVATPTEHHLQPTLASLDHGAHVLVEKPIMATLAEASTTIERSEKTGCHVLVGHQRRYYPQVHQARELIVAGRLGKLVAVAGQWTMRKPEPYYAPEWRKQWKAGPVLTNLIHEIDSLRYICGDIDSIVADTSNVVQGFEKEDVAALILRFKSGALGSFMLSDQTLSPWSWESAIGENAAIPQTSQNAIRFMGTKGSLDFPNLTLWNTNDPQPDWSSQLEPEVIEHSAHDPYIAQLEHFSDVILGKEPPRITAKDATATLHATAAVLEAARSGARVDLAGV